MIIQLVCVLCYTKRAILQTCLDIIDHKASYISSQFIHNIPYYINFNLWIYIFVFSLSLSLVFLVLL